MDWLKSLGVVQTPKRQIPALVYLGWLGSEQLDKALEVPCCADIQRKMDESSEPEEKEALLPVLEASRDFYKCPCQGIEPQEDISPEHAPVWQQTRRNLKVLTGADTSELFVCPKLLATLPWVQDIRRHVSLARELHQPIHDERAVVWEAVDIANQAYNHRVRTEEKVQEKELKNKLSRMREEK